VAFVVAGCTYPATEALVALGTDAPRDQPFSVTITVAVEGSGHGNSRTFVHDETRADSVAFPATFGIVPSSSSDAATQLDIVATLGASGSVASMQIHRTVRFAFIRHTTAALPVFLPVACIERVTGCTSVVADACTLSQFCEDNGLTCGNNGRCASIDQALVPTDPDAGAAVILAGTGVDAPIDESPFDAIVDASSDGTVDSSVDTVDATAETVDAGSWSPFGTITNVAAVNGGGNEYGPTLTADALVMYFTREMAPSGAYVATRSRTADPFNAPIYVTVDGAGGVNDPDVSPDGSSLRFMTYWGSTYTIVESTRVAVDHFSINAMACVAPICTGSEQLEAPSTTPDLLTMVYGVRPNAGSSTAELFIATRTNVTNSFSNATAIGITAGDGVYESFPWISPDTLTIYFEAETAPHNSDVYVATRPNTSVPFGAALPVTEVNTSANEGDPFVTADGTTIYFTSDQAGGSGLADIYAAVRHRL
jgi:hypothetical protein